MRQLLILSGKGGTGKTTVASAFIRLSQAEAFADADVDAPNLHLIYAKDMDLSVSEAYYAMPSAVVDTEKCVGCMACAEYCKFGAISSENGHAYVDVHSCEGCGVCQLMCPCGAIDMAMLPEGETMLYRGQSASVFSTAHLNIGSGTTGKLVSTVKKNLLKNAIDKDIAIIDGSPGIGCPVIASLSGVDLVLIVAEPSLSGVSDMKRIVDTARGFGVRIVIAVNKYDTSLDETANIERYATENDIPFVGKIPYDREAISAINGRNSIVDVDCEAGKAVREIYRETMKYM